MAVLRPFPKFSAYDDNGNPLALGKVYTYVVGTSTPKTTYTEQTEAAANANPVILDAAGRANIWFDGPTKIVLKDSADVTITTVDSIGSVDEFTILQSETANFATSGQVRLARADTIAWRNNAATANNTLNVDSDDQLRFDGKWSVINQQGALAAVVGTGADATLFTYSMPANKMLASKGIRVRWCLTHTTGVAATTYKLKFGSTTLQSAASAVTTDILFGATIFNNSGVQNAQTVLSEPWISGTAIIVTGGQTTSAENTANALTVSTTFSVAATDQVTPKFWLVEVLN